MAEIVRDMIKRTKIEFLKNDMELLKMTICKKSFEVLSKELELVVRYSSEKLPENQLRYLGVLIEREAD